LVLPLFIFCLFTRRFSIIHEFIDKFMSRICQIVGRCSWDVDRAFCCAVELFFITEFSDYWCMDDLNRDLELEPIMQATARLRAKFSFDMECISSRD
jgi:hypothetical protein